MQNLIKYAELSGIFIPAALKEAEDEARRKVATIRDKKGELSGRMEAAEDKISDLVSQEAAALVAGDADSKIVRRRERAKQNLTGAAALLSEMEKIESKAQNELTEAEQTLQSFISDRLAGSRATMLAHLDIVQNERARQLGSLRAGEVVRSSRPARNARSRIAVCECCKQDIGIFDPAMIALPIRAEHFEKLPRDSYTPFIPGATIEYFRCPRCGKKPWWEHDRILTNAGFYVVDSHEEPQGKKEGKNDV